MGVPRPWRQHSVSRPCITAASPRPGTRHRFALTACALLMLSFAMTGCAEPRAADVDVELARRTLVQVLEHWKSGGEIDDFRSQSPEIVIQEELWYSGRQLLDFTLQDAARPVNANWFCDVELVVASEDGGKPQRKTVTYAVGTDPVLTVFHSML